MRAWVHAGAAALLGVLFLLLLQLPGLSDTDVTVVSDLGQLAAVSVAATLCWLVSRAPGAHVRAWQALAVGVGAWAAGQAVWTYYEVYLGQDVPFPSPADIGFLMFPIASGFGLLAWLGTQGHIRAAARGRDVLDGSIIALSLLVLSWVTSLGAIAHSSTGGWLAMSLSLAYPIGDIILGTLVLLAVARGRPDERPVLVLLAVGLGALALADSAYLYLVSLQEYASADAVSSGWVFGFLFVGAAAQLERSRSREPRAMRSVDGLVPSLIAATVPYLPFGAAGLAVAFSLINDPGRSGVELLLGVALVVLVLARQFLAMAENQRLYVALGAARDQLQQQALHDSLTGLANRTLFTDRLDQAMARTDHHVGLLFCDLDDFKKVNDTWGHDIGDLLLRSVAERLLACVRGQDTVARIGGDEFTVLLDDPEDARRVAERIVAATARPFDLRGETIQITMSVGAVDHHTHAVTSGRRLTDLVDAGTPGSRAHGLTGSDLLLRVADQAMYTAKTSGKDRAIVADDQDDLAAGA